MKVLKNNLAKNDIFVISGYGLFIFIRPSKYGLLSGADPGFVVGGGVSRRGVWGTSWSRVEPWFGAQPPEALGILGITYIYLNDNFEPTTPFLSDQNNLILSLNFVG